MSDPLSFKALDRLGLVPLAQVIEIEFRIEPRMDGGFDFCWRHDRLRHRFPLASRREAYQFAAFAAVTLAEEFERASRERGEIASIKLPCA